MVSGGWLVVDGYWEVVSGMWLAVEGVVGVEACHIRKGEILTES